MRNRLQLVLAAVAFAAAANASAGTVDVQFVNPSNYVDAGTSSWDEEDNMKALANYLQKLGQHWLSPGQVLKVDVLDLDLAGTVRASRRDAEPIRVIRGRTDVPRITLRYTLTADGRVLQSAQEVLTDLNYGRGLPAQRDYSGLYNEKKMLERWFRTQFGDLRASR